MFGSTWDSACSFFADLFSDLVAGCTSMNILGLGGLCNNSGKRRCGDELSFAAVPFREDFCRWSTAQDAGVDETSEFDAWQVTGCAVNAGEVPDGFCA
jgi:hypothetical protein